MRELVFGLCKVPGNLLSERKLLVSEEEVGSVNLVTWYLSNDMLIIL
jgi:hypothetical protein